MKLRAQVLWCIRLYMGYSWQCIMSGMGCGLQNVYYTSGVTGWFLRFSLWNSVVASAQMLSRHRVG